MIQRAAIVGSLCVLMVVIHALGALLGGPFTALGLHPRALSGLPGIVTAPLVHEDLAHLGNNLWAFMIFSALCLLNGPRIFALASAIIIVLGGGMLWLFGRDAIHIGASGWVFGLWSFAIAQGWFERSPRTITIAVIVVVLYGGVAWGLLPTDSGVSYEGHMFGALAGVVAAWLLARHAARTPQAAARSDVLKFWS